MDDQKAQFIGRRPGHIRGLATPALLRLIYRSLHRYDDVAQFGPTARWAEVRHGSGRFGRRLAGVRREGRRVEQGEGDDVGRAVLVKDALVEVGQLGVIGQSKANRGWRRRTGRHQAGGNQPGQVGRR